MTEDYYVSRTQRNCMQTSKRTAPTPSTEMQYEIPDSVGRFLWFGIRPYKWWFFAALFIAVFSAALGQGSSYAFKVLVDAIEVDNIELAMWAGLAYPAVIFVTQTLYRVSGYLTHYQVNHSKSYIYKHLIAHTMGHSTSYFADRFAGSLVNKLHNVSRGFDSLVTEIIWTYANIIITLVVTAALIFQVNVPAGCILLVLIAAIIVINQYLARRKRALAAAEAAARSALSGKSSDLFSNVEAVRQYVQRAFEFSTMQRATERVRNSANKSAFYTEGMLFINGVILFMAFAGIMYFTLESWQLGEITSGDLVLVLVLFSQITGMFIFIGQSFQAAARSFGDMDEGLKEVIVPHEVADMPTARALQVTDGQIVWQKVRFEYGQNVVFDDFYLSIKPGQRVGLVGPSGAGKTTFVSLLLRQHDLHNGAIMIDGQNIAEVTQDSLRQHIAVVPQEPLLFHRSIRENIAYGKPDATDQEVIDVAVKAQAHDFIVELPDGYDTLVGERGVKLSGGQKQRVAIARAMLKDAPILVLDEATSALDSESEVAIQKALHELMARKTVIAIAHRLSTLREMDRIIVLEAGKIVEDGSHESLIRAGGTYQRLWEHQAGGFLTE